MFSERIEFVQRKFGPLFSKDNNNNVETIKQNY